MASDEEDNDTSTGRGVEAPSERVQEFYLRMLGTAEPTAPGLGEFAGTWANAIAFANNPARADAAVDGWTPLGPRTVGGAVRSLAQDPLNPSTFYAGTAGAGLWRTTDDGVTWTQLGGNTFGASPVGAVAVAPTAPQNTLYVGTGEPLAGSISGLGLYKSTDGGATFTSMAPATAGAGGSPRYTRVRVHPTRPDVIWAAGQNGLWRFDSTGAHREDVFGTGVDKNITDLAIAPGPAGGNTALLIAGVHGEVVRRGIYDPAVAPNPTTWSASTLNTTGTDLPQHMGRVKVAIAPSDPSVVYAMVEDQKSAGGDGGPQPLYVSSDGGVNFSQKPQGQSNRNASWPSDTSSKQAFYSMVLEVHPNQPKTVIAGHVNLYLSLDGGQSWPHELIKWENNWRFAQRAEHGDMHAIVFDRRDALSPTPRLWIGNDGGVSYTDAWSSQFNWRKRSYGILAGQVVDVTSHPVYPSIIACGMQDNATFISYGGPTWHQIAWADGAAAVLDPTDARRLFISWQSGFAEARIASGDARPDFKQELPEVPATDGSSPTAPQTNFLTSKLDIRGNSIGKDPIFRALLVGDTTVANRFVVGRKEAAYITTNGSSFDKLETGDFTPTGDPNWKVEAGALALVPGGSGVYVSSSTGDLFVPKAGGATGWDKKTPFTGWSPTAKPWICGIAVHPTKQQVVAACAYVSTVSIMLSHDGGQTWFSAAGAVGQLPPGPITCLAFHPTDEKVLFAGSLAGVFVARDLPAYSAVTPATSANPTWKTLLKGAMNGKPMLINDLEVVPTTLTLRAGTFSSGVYEMNIADSSLTYTTPIDFQVKAVRLSIRDHALDDSRTYPPAHALPGDPRLPSAHDTSHLDGSHSIDIKVDSSDLDDRTRYLLSERFRHQPDAAELDEEFVCQNPIAGDVNVAYIQVHNRGYDKATGVNVRLYVGDAGPLGVAPALDGINWASNPTAASGWTLLEEKTGLDVAAGDPKVVRFEWTCPVALKSYAALLAVCYSAADALAPADVPSTGSSLEYAKRERRAALRVLPVIQDRLFIRDGLDDRGRRGSVAWGGTSPDIMVMTKADADALFDVNNPTTGPFKNLNDARRADRVRTGDTAIFVRVSNRGSVPINAEVRLYRATMDHITDATWTQVGAAPVAVNAIPARGWRVARFDLAAADGGDPAPTKPAWAKSYFFAAVVRVLDPSDGTEVEPFPDPSSITDVDAFWRFFGRGSSGNNAAFRTVRFEGAT